MEFKEEEEGGTDDLEVEVEFKEEEQVILSVGGRGGVQGGRRGGTGDLVGIGSRGGIQGGRTGRFECDGGRGGVQGGRRRRNK